MKLLFVIKTLVWPGGGAERVMAEVTGALARRGHSVTIANFDSIDSTPFYDFDPAVRLLPLGIGDVYRPTRRREALQRMARLRAHALEISPDVAIGFMHSVYIPLGIALLGTGIPLVASEHIAWEHYRGRRLEAALLRLAPRLARTITAISPAIRDGFPASIRRRMTVVPNPVGVAGGARADVVAQGRDKTLLAVGRLQEQKDHRTLIAAFARIAADFPDWTLRIVGEGVLRPELEAQVRRLGLEDRILLPGPSREIAVEYERAQLFAIPSLYESFGLTSAEALTHGLPVIGFADCPGTNELVRHGVNGLLAAGPIRSAALAACLAEAMASPGLRAELAEAAPASIEPFAPERIADRWEELLQRIAENS